MGTKDDKTVWTGVSRLAGADRKDTNSSIDSGELEGQDMPDSDKEESNRRVGRDLREVDSRYSFRGNKLRVYPQNEEEL